MESSADNLFDQPWLAIRRVRQHLRCCLTFFRSPSFTRQSAGWTCLSWLQLLCDQPEDALRSARLAVKFNAQDPQARINLSLALLETKSKGVRDHIQVVQQVIAFAPEAAGDLKTSINDGLQRKPGWKALEKVKAWLDF